MPALRITGLVAASTRIRSRLRAGLGPDDVTPLKREVDALVRRVDALCASRGVAPGDLPGPSRMAYRFLRELEVERHVAPGAGGTSSPVRIGNAVRVGHTIAGRLWHHLPSLVPEAPAWARLERELRTNAAAIEQICARQGATPSALERPSRRVYCWLAYLGTASQLVVHVEALRRARAALRAAPPDPRRPVLVHLVNTDALWRTRPSREAVVLTVNEGFVHADAAVWRAVVRCALAGRQGADARRVHDFAESDAFGAVLFDLEALAPTVTAARGRVHSLDESFARVNAAYFAGRMPKPALVWSAAPTARTFGHYQRSRDTVLLSSSLDDPRVPTSVVDLVLYHELLHKHLAPTVTNGGRRVAHGRSFRAAERRFAAFDEATRLLGQIAAEWRRAAR